MLFETTAQRQTRIQKQKQSNAEYLRLCLSKTSKQVGILSLNLWYASQDTMLSVATLLEDNGYLNTASEAIRFFEKPWHFEQDMAELAETLEREAKQE